MYASFLQYICIVKGRGASAGTLAPAVGYAPARVPNHCRYCRSLAGALAHRLQRLCIIVTYASLLKDEEQVPAHWRRQQEMRRHVFPAIVDSELVHWHSVCNMYDFCGTYVALLSDEGQVPVHWRRQQDMHRHVFPTIVDCWLMH